jgi:hypothetical protein
VVYFSNMSFEELQSSEQGIEIFQAQVKSKLQQLVGVVDADISRIDVLPGSVVANVYLLDPNLRANVYAVVAGGNFTLNNQTAAPCVGQAFLVGTVTPSTAPICQVFFKKKQTKATQIHTHQRREKTQK